MKEFFLLPPRELLYERNIYIFLSAFRAVSFMLAATLMFTIPLEPASLLRALLIITFVGIYTVFKILFRFRIWQADIWTYTILVVDVAISLALVLLTGGVDSPFLLYSLLPIITASLFFWQALTLIIATLTSLNLILAHTVLPIINPSFTFILAPGHYLGSVIVYVSFCFLIASITYLTNLNVYRHIQSSTIVEERRMLRREIHDGIAQVMGYLGTKMNLMKQSLPSSEEKLLAEMEEMHHVMQESYEDIREAIEFLDTEVEPISLIASLSHYVEELGKRTGIQTKFTATKLPTLHPTAQLQLLRIAQEALSNVRKHAAASQVRVKLETRPQSVELVVKDNGQGFSPGEQKGTGLRIMEERASGIKGTLTITSSPGKGTEVRVKVPRR